MLKFVATAVLSAFVSVFLYARMEPQKVSPGSERFSPTRIDWLVTSLQADLREEMTQDRGYSMDFTYSGADPDTIIVWVRYLPNMAPVKRQNMNSSIETARNVINTTTKRYGWEDWVKVKEEIQSGKP